MKILSFILAALCSSSLSWAQLKTTPLCPPLTVEILDGNVNGLYPKSAIGDIKTTLPCFSEVVEKDSTGKCIGVFYRDRDIYFYTDRRYIEIGEKFKGKMSPSLLGASRSSLFTTLGHPKIKDISWDAFQTEYGTLILYYNKAGKINKIQMSSKSTDAIKLCE